jgi:hypothetical protein
MQLDGGAGAAAPAAGPPDAAAELAAGEHTYAIKCTPIPIQSRSKIHTPTCVIKRVNIRIVTS